MRLEFFEPAELEHSPPDLSTILQVVDMVDPATWPEARRQLDWLAAERPVAVLANKVDHASAADNANLHTAVNVNTGNGRCA